MGNDMSKTAQELGFSYIISVTLDKGIKKPLDYGVKPTITQKISVGSRVLVPVRNSLNPATVVKIKNSTHTPGVRPIEKLVFEKPLLSPHLFKLAEWMSAYYTTPLSKVLKTMLPTSVTTPDKEKMLLFAKPALSLSKLSQLADKFREKKRSRAALIDLLLKNPKGLFVADLLKIANVSSSPLKTLAKEGIVKLEQKRVLRSPLEDVPFFKTLEKILLPEQQQAFDAISTDMEKEKACTHLLFGVTGSGKTEVYLRLIKKARQMNKGILFLVPEIALTSQTIERVKTRFDEKIGVLHHKLSSGEKHDIWHQIQQGKIQIVIGARSAIFSPIKNLGLILIDEEQEPAFKQTEEMPCYHARDMAIVRSKYENATVVLGSATPSLETYFNAQNGTYTLHELKKRANNNPLPKIHLIDQSSPLERVDGNHTLFSNSLKKAITARVEKGEQIILFLNRRGYNTCMLCQDCQSSFNCPSCDLPLTFHKALDTLKCHTCDYHIHPTPKVCPTCNKREPILFKGVGTEKVERTLHALFPGIRSLRLDGESTKQKGSHATIYQKFLSGKADVLIGTQMVAKGLHFPKVTLVGVMNTDGALNIPDFRSAEKCFSLLTQVSGRAGRGEVLGEVMIQTYLKDNSVLKHVQSGSYPLFYHEEIDMRKAFFYPPFCRITKIIGKSKNENFVQQQMDTIHHYLKTHAASTMHISPPSPCGHAKIKDSFRYQIILKRPPQDFFPQALASFISAQTSSRFHVTINHDPQTIFF
ncbi:primosomal protein N' [Candidatus Aerophobetes bacterium]|uniref:Replication restart protein PriA n=1 Tax=Aerophobetes bacterium TaxID=2030807 RepID=A0A2A4X5J6_UNCAE|nr:MAG: primosomal protein N' [Candidatus Aerophobetes bacterium]